MLAPGEPGDRRLSLETQVGTAYRCQAAVRRAWGRQGGAAARAGGALNAAGVAATPSGAPTARAGATGGARRPRPSPRAGRCRCQARPAWRRPSRRAPRASSRPRGKRGPGTQLGAEVTHRCGHVAIGLGLDQAGGERVVAVGVVAGRERDQVGGVPAADRDDDVLDQRQELLAAGAGGHRQVDRVACRAPRPCTGSPGPGISGHWWMLA